MISSTDLGDMPEKKTQVYDWNRKFVEGPTAIENTLHACHPRKSLTEGNIGEKRDTIESVTYYCSKQNVLISKNYMQFPIREVILPHHNACLHTVNQSREKLMEVHWTNLEHPPYIPDLSSCNVLLSKEVLCGERH